ncbi:hypothetical protein STVIR_7242 [Streptomyces viridochromogenes Tue57]|uniref:Uncharacterized protein n=1 Tax=Streptomyces viridochromogenes Tue57 TaxID=1160705 RepID=L8P2I1_STRVR|nr:hypothetical protein STVIR_7242 [Streptomyces viridochromogenes Tue57]
MARLKQLTDHGIRGAETRNPSFDRETDPRAARIHVPITMDEQGWERMAAAVDSIRDVVGAAREAGEAEAGEAGEAKEAGEAGVPGRRWGLGRRGVLGRRGRPGRRGVLGRRWGWGGR